MTYSELRRMARENLEGNWKKSLGVAFVASIFGALIAGSNFSLDLDLEREVLQQLPDVILSFLAVMVSASSALSLVHFILAGPVQLGYAKVLLKQYHRQEFEVKDLFSQFDRFKQGFLMNLLRTLYIFLWTLLFIIPGIVASYKYALAPFLMTENPEMTAKEAIAASTELMDGYKGHLFMLDLSFIGWDLLAMLTLGIGFLWLNPYKNAAHAVFYRQVLAEQKPAIE